MLLYAELPNGTKLLPEPVTIELGHPWKPEKGKYIDLRTAETSVLLFYLNSDVVASQVDAQLEGVVPWSKGKTFRESVTMAVVMGLLKLIGAELDRRLPQRWG